VANTIQNGRWTCQHVVNPMQNGRWTCPNVANTMQNDKFKVQTVANTRQIVPARKSKKNKPAQKKILKLFHTHIIFVNLYKSIYLGCWFQLLKTNQKTAFSTLGQCTSKSFHRMRFQIWIPKLFPSCNRTRQGEIWPFIRCHGRWW
jgi:hypothetical protein